MQKMTITEALAEVKLIGKKIDTKRSFIMSNVARIEKIKDPLISDGGSPKVLSSELQAIRDLQEQVIRIRRAIMTANLKTELTIGGRSRTVAEWLTWRREVSAQAKEMTERVAEACGNARNTARQRSVAARGPQEPEGAADGVVINIDEMENQRRREEIVETLGKLDGQLSLMNATVVVEF